MYQLLTGCRALDLTDDKGYLCGKVLADLGVEVIKVERPGGDSGRRLGPFYHDIPSPEKSLYWFAYNINKKGITLDIEKVNGKEIFKKLVETADFVLESFAPGYLDNLGLGYGELSKLNKGVVLTSISPFGQTGPYKDYKAYDLVALAMSGLMYVTGEPDRPPVCFSFPQAYLLASAEAAASTMLAHYHKKITGEGQHVDTSAQACFLTTLTNMIPRWELSRIVTHRAGSRRMGLFAQADVRSLYRCRDGFVAFLILGGISAAKTNRALVEWMDSEGMADDYLRSMDWLKFDFATVTEEEIQRVESYVEKFFLAHTKAEIFEGAKERAMILQPLMGIPELLHYQQLEVREFWQEVEHPELGDKITYPGPVIKLSQAPVGPERRAPFIGEHNKEIYVEELGFSREDIMALEQEGVI